MYRKYPFVVEIEPAEEVRCLHDSITNSESCLCYCERIGNSLPWGQRYIREVNKLYFHKDEGVLILLGGRSWIKVRDKNFSLRYLRNGSLRLLFDEHESFYR